MTVGARRARTTILVAGIAVGLIARLVAVASAPRYGYLQDHLDWMAWGSWARTHGVLAIYDMQPELVPLLRVALDPQSGQPATYLAFAPHACNYPPFSAYVYWVKGALWHALDDDVRRIPAPPTLRALLEQLGLPPTLELRTVNTRLARAVDAAPSFLFEVLLGLGVARLVRLLRGRHAAGVDGAAAFVLTFAAPAVIFDGALWGQSDAWIGAMLVWCLAWWLDGRYVAAGAAYGLALLTKPQAILLAPVLAYALVGLRYRPEGSWGAVLRALRAVPAALVVMTAVAAPFMVHDVGAGAGAWRWFERGYVATIASQDYAYTTLNAFNLWWVEALLRWPWAADGDWWRSLDSTRPLLGVAKDRIGQLLLVLSLGLGALLCARRRGWGAPACTTLAYLVLLSAFLLPTRVHERYVFYCLPFVTALAVCERAWWLPFVVLSLVGTAEMLSHLWVAPTPVSLVVSGTAAVAALGMLPYGWHASRRGAEESEAGAGRRDSD